eukprot:CAMPEP_0116835748 /NCGR_PEP_ID=MMETSP0418-20121206/7714_1 /TAXON_ID=1158023 /ORGANISM="Astrosyne radiata, Strain 13vi08-1A" /LENGTH=128 /DNA_ID=CAMNT_0004465443 /DNA_START=238 /DNA_END=624 /DNA_ORIENTATION=+
MHVDKMMMKAGTAKSDNLQDSSEELLKLDPSVLTGCPNLAVYRCMVRQTLSPRPAFSSVHDQRWGRLLGVQDLDDYNYQMIKPNPSTSALLSRSDKFLLMCDRSMKSFGCKATKLCSGRLHQTADGLD